MLGWVPAVMKNKTWVWHLVLACALGLLISSGCGTDEDVVDPNPGQDMSGLYDINFAEQLVFKLDLGQGIRAAVMPAAEGWAEFGNWEGEPLLLDVAEFCGRAEIHCPFAVFPEAVAVEQVDKDIVLGAHGIIIHDQASDTAGERLWRGIVDHNNYDRFRIPSDQLLPLEFGPCVAFEESQLKGRFEREFETLSGVTVTWEEGEPVSGIAEGIVSIGWPARCAFGEGVPENATLWLDVAFTGQRRGAFAPGESEESSEELADGTEDVAVEDVAMSQDAGPTEDSEPATNGFTVDVQQVDGGPSQAQP